MTRRQRVINSFIHRESDIIPYTVGYTIPQLERLISFTGDPEFEIRHNTHIDMVAYSGRPYEMPEKPQYFADDFGVVWNRSGADKDIGVVDNLIIQDIERNPYTLPPIPETWWRQELEKGIAKKDDKFLFAGIGFSMFERAWSLCGMENTLINMILCPEGLVELLNKICTFNMRLVDIALEYDAIDGIHFGDDWGQQKGLIMGTTHWKRYIKPQMKKLYERVHTKGRFVSQHSCGDVNEIFPDLIEIGLDCYNTFQPEIYDVEKVKRQYGADLTFWGGISTQRLLPHATPEEVKRQTVYLMSVLGKNGGYIAAPTHAIMSDTPPENVLAMLDVFENQAKYL